MPRKRKSDSSVNTPLSVETLSSKRPVRTARLNHKILGAQAEENHVRHDEDVVQIQEKDVEFESSSEVICIECPPTLDDVVMLELPHKTDRVLLKKLEESSTDHMEVLSSMQATLVESVLSQLEQKNPKWKREIFRQCDVTIEGSILQGSHDQFNKAINIIQEMIEVQGQDEKEIQSEDDREAQGEDGNVNKAVNVRNEPTTCVFCLEKFPTMREKTKHIQKNHKPQEIVREMPLFSKIKWDQVLTIIDPPADGSSRCTLCDKEVEDITDHFYSSHPDTEKCFHCDATFDNEEELSVHQMTHINRSKLLQCIKCGHEGNLTSMKHHVPTSHKDDLTISSATSFRKFFKCPSCTQSFETTKSCILHMSKCNQIGPRVDFDDYMIEIDPKTEETPLILTSNDSEMTSQCLKCSFAGTHTQVQKHAKEKHPEKLLKCKYCVQSFKTLVSLSKHTQTHFDKNGELKPLKDELKKLYQCSICGFTAVKYGMNMHLTRAHGLQRYNVVQEEAKFKCSICKKEFHKKTAFQCHEWRCKKKKVSRAIKTRSVDDEVDKLIQEVKGGEKDNKVPNIIDGQMMRYNEDNLTEEEKRKIVSYGIERMSEVFPDNGFPVEHKHVYRCRDCFYISTFHGMTQHRRRHHRQAKFKCPECPRSFVLKCEMENHRKNYQHKLADEDHEAEETYIVGNKCLPMTSKHRDKIVNQLITIHKCIECGFKGIYDAVRKHIISTHLDSSLCCKYCEKIFTNSQVKAIHERSHISKDGQVIPARGNPDKPSAFVCKFCSKEFKHRQQLQIHEARKHGTTKYSCQHCSKSYTLETDLINHIKIKHSDASAVTCLDCGTEFACNAYLTNHIRRVHSDQQWLQCDICLKMCRHAEALKKHRKIHLPDDMKPVFKCSECPREFCSETALRDHMNKHSGEQPYACSQCNERFFSASNLSRHRRKHQNPSHSCPYYDCSAQFHSMLELVKHLNKVHSNSSTLVCSRCHCLFIDKEMLKHHECSDKKAAEKEDGEITFNEPTNRQEIADSMLYISVQAAEEEDGEIANEPTNRQEIADNENSVYMCGQCNIIMPTLDEMKEHASVCETGETVKKEEDQVIVLNSEADLVHMVCETGEEVQADDKPQVIMLDAEADVVHMMEIASEETVAQ